MTGQFFLTLVSGHLGTCQGHAVEVQGQVSGKETKRLSGGWQAAAIDIAVYRLETLTHRPIRLPPPCGRPAVAQSSLPDGSHLHSQPCQRFSKKSDGSSKSWRFWQWHLTVAVDQASQLGMDPVATSVPKSFSLFSLGGPSPSKSVKSKGHGLVYDVGCSTVTRETLSCKDRLSPDQILKATVFEKILFSAIEASSFGVPCLYFNLNSIELPLCIIDTIHCAQASSNRAPSSHKWYIWELVSTIKGAVPVQCSVQL